MGVPLLGGLALQTVPANLKALIFDSGIDIGVDSTTSERRYLVQSLDLHDRIRNHSEHVAMPLRLAREESTREHRVDSEPIQSPGPRTRSGIERLQRPQE